MMRISSSPHHGKKVGGFTLPVVLVVVGALLILAISALLVTGIERSTARSFGDRQRAELAARTGLEDIRGLLTQEAANDDFLIIQSSEHLFLARGIADGGAYSYRYVPLFSAASLPPDNAALTPPPVDPLLGTAAKDHLDFSTLPYRDPVRASWLPIEDEKGRTVARYAYWVEDLQSRLDPAIAGNQIGAEGRHGRAAWPFPAPGLNPVDEAKTEPSLSQVALYAIDPAATSDIQGELGKTLIANRKLLVSPDSVLASAGILPPLTRLTTKQLADPKARAAEEGLVADLCDYDEQALVPFSEGVSPTAAGKPKLNLNKLLANGGAAAVDEMADFIHRALPQFEKRKGGFPDNYLKTLAANALDYADGNADSTTDGATYRGVDCHPLVSEFLMRFRWDDILTEGGRKYVVLKVATYAELWNMTDQPVSGAAEFTHDTRYSFKMGASPDEITLDDMTTVTPVLTESGGAHWFPPIQITLNPNEYRVIKFGEVTYKLDVGSQAFIVPSPLTLKNEKYGVSGAGYQLKWNTRLVDQARGGVHRNDSSLEFPNGNRQSVRATNPATSYKIGSFYSPFMQNMGDLRMSFYLQAPQEAVAYPVNYSPNRRNIRYHIYEPDEATKTKLHGRVMPSEWPDGGHNSTCESTVGLLETNTQLDPDDVKFRLSASSILHEPAVGDAPARLSDQSRFYSVTELGRVYDPIMWDVARPTGANLPWGDIEAATAPAKEYGGGNTLRIGRPEHPQFDLPAMPGMEAWRLLDLFHTGRSRSGASTAREGGVIHIQGHVNLNTAGRDVLRALAVGPITMDPKMAIRISEPHVMTGLMAPPVEPFQMIAADINTEADRIADSIILKRKAAPFSSPSGLAEVCDASGSLVFGNKSLIPGGSKVERTDSAAEEIFARVYEASTVRSRNFRVWIVGQAVSGSASPEVLSEVRKVFTVFADPGERTGDGSINPLKFHLKILYENSF